jgi:hypothetical protein
LHFLQVCLLSHQLLLLYSFLFIIRQAHAVDADHVISAFGSRTATGTLRRHLFEAHVEAWVTACDDRNIEITAQEAQPAIDAYRKLPGKTVLEDSRPEYSKEAFIDALVEFIVADDQVSTRLSSCTQH